MNERFIRRRIPVFINSFNQLNFLNDTLEWFLRHGFSNISILDSNSNYPQLLRFLEDGDAGGRFKLVRFRRNIGPRKALLRVCKIVGRQSPFIFTDPDLWLPDEPSSEMIEFMFDVGERFQLPKVGLALDISEPERFDPSIKYKGYLPHEWEKQFWQTPLEPNVYKASVDTTFFLSTANPKVEMRIDEYKLKQPKVPAARISSSGFLAKHRPWYADSGQPEEEKEFYRNSASSVTSWV